MYTHWSTTLRTYLVEAQKIFVPALSAIVLEAGLEIVHAADRLDFRSMVEVSPDVVFADLDFIQSEPTQAVHVMRALLPEGIICVYTSNLDGNKEEQYRASGADAVFSKAASRGDLVQGIQDIISASHRSPLV